MEIKICKLEPTLITIQVEEMTKRELEYIKKIEEFKYKNHKAPTIRQISEIMELSSSATSKNMVDRLKKKGYDYKRI